MAGEIKELSSEKHGIRNGVIGGLILSFLLWAVGFLPSLWNWVKSLPNDIWEFLISDLSISGWLFSLILIATFIAAWWVRFLIAPSKGEDHNSADTGQGSSEPRQPLSDNELKVLKIIASGDGRDVHVNTIARYINQNKLRTDQACELLIQKGYVKNLFGESYHLSSKGRDLAIELGYA